MNSSVNLRLLAKIWLAGVFSLAGSAVYALPSLQIGPDGDSNWNYVGATGFGSTNTWLYTGADPFGFSAYGNATGADGGNGAYPFNDAARTAYLVVAAVPKPANNSGGDLFQITVTNDGGSLSLHESAFGNPPVLDPNSLAPHGVYETWFEVYEFNFDEAITDIGNTEPPPSNPPETGKGYVEDFTIDVLSTAALVEGLHIDLFTVKDGIYNPITTPSANNLVSNVAPFSHDAEWHPSSTSTTGGPSSNGEPIPEPEPTILVLFGTGLLILGMLWRRRSTQGFVENQV